MTQDALAAQPEPTDHHSIEWWRWWTRMTCPGCGNKSIQDDGRCTVCGSIKQPERTEPEAAPQAEEADPCPSAIAPPPSPPLAAQSTDYVPLPPRAEKPAKPEKKTRAKKGSRAAEAAGSTPDTTETVSAPATSTDPVPVRPEIDRSGEMPIVGVVTSAADPAPKKKRGAAAPGQGSLF